MFTIRQINKKKDYKKFVRFPTELYKDNPNYVPPMEMDEMKMTGKNNPHYGECTDAYFLAEDENGKVVGRIAVVIMDRFNKKNNAKYARFTRFDFIDNKEVAQALLATAESWAKEHGMEHIHGPLGYDDFEREGLLVYGYENVGSFITSYNAPYYKDYIEDYGYKPDARWVEWRFKFPQKLDSRVERIANVVENRYGFHQKSFKNMNQLIRDYGEAFFELIDETFSELYGTFEVNDKLKQSLIDNFKLVLDTRYVCFVFDKRDNFIGFGLTWPSLAKAMKKSNGRLLPFGIFRALKAIKHPTVMELGIIAVKKEYQKLGVTAFIIKNLLENINKIPNFEYADTGVQLETNTGAITSLEMFERTLIRKKTCYIKSLVEEKQSEEKKKTKTTKKATSKKETSKKTVTKKESAKKTTAKKETKKKTETKASK